MFGLGASSHRLAEAHAPLPAPLSVLVGLAALAMVSLDEIWRIAQHVNTIAHEGAHALAGSSMGHKIARVAIKSNGDGETIALAPGSRGRAVSLFAGYVGPSGFGLLAAKLISPGHAGAVLWLAVVLLAILLPVLSDRFSLLCVLITAGLLLFFVLYTAAGVAAAVAYGLTWFLLLSGIRMVLAHGRGAGDAGKLREATRLPRALWVGLWLTGTVLALVVGGIMLV